MGFGTVAEIESPAQYTSYADVVDNEVDPEQSDSCRYTIANMSSSCYEDAQEIYEVEDLKLILTSECAPDQAAEPPADQSWRERPSLL